MYLNNNMIYEHINSKIILVGNDRFFKFIITGLN